MKPLEQAFEQASNREIFSRREIPIFQQQQKLKTFEVNVFHLFTGAQNVNRIPLHCKC